MNAKKIFDQQEAVLLKALPSLAQIHWPTYGSKFVTEDEKGNLKYQGLMRRYYPGGERGFSTPETRLGVILDPKRSHWMLRNKLDILAQHGLARTSMEMRSPPLVWGGAIRTLGGVSGITGLPETGDHLTETHLSWFTDQITEEDYKSLIRSDHECLVAAREMVGMSEDQWYLLSHRIHEIILAAVM
jgi:hypothetical protein